MAQQHINYGSSPNDGTGDTLRVSQVKTESNFNELYTNKVDKVVGKGLSDTNFTQAEKDKLSGLTEGGQVQADWDQGDNLELDYIKNKPVNVSEFNNDSQYVPDTGTAVPSVRINGEWIPLSVSNELKILDAVIGVTVGYAAGQQNFNLPGGAIVKDVWLSHAKQYKITANNTALTNKWSQAGDVLTITKTPILNNYLYIEYV